MNRLISGQPDTALATVSHRKTLEEKLHEKQTQIAARLAVIAQKKKSVEREKLARLDRIIGAACRADESLHDAIKAALDRGVKAPKDREFLKIEAWI